MPEKEIVKEGSPKLRFLSFMGHCSIFFKSHFIFFVEFFYYSVSASSRSIDLGYLTSVCEHKA